MLPLRVPPDDEYWGLNVVEHGASTELLDLAQTMEHQAQSGDLSVRAAVEPFTEVGQIAERYNFVLDSLCESQTLYASLVDNLPVYVVRKDLQGRITFANKTLCKWLKMTRGDLLGKTDYDF